MPVHANTHKIGNGSSQGSVFRNNVRAFCSFLGLFFGHRQF